MDNAFDAFDFSEDEVAKALEDQKGKRFDRDGRICICGHPVARHGSPKDLESGVVSCHPSKIWCPCIAVRPVLEVSDTRDFLFKTTGSGVNHALGKGMKTAKDKNHEVKWLQDICCDVCKEVGPVSPVPVSERLMVVQKESPRNHLMCRKCREERM